MATLTTTAVIRAHDEMTGPLAAMASRTNAIAGRFASGARRMGMATGALGIGAVGGVYGFTALLNKAEEFNKAIFGIGAANLPELIDEKGEVKTDLALQQMQEIERASMGLSRELRMSATDIAQISETLAKAGMDDDKMLATTRAAATLSKTDLETPANQMADFLHTLSVIQKQADGESFGNFMQRQADMTYAAAATTKLSVGSIMEGMRQFQTVGAGMGLQTEEMLALVMGGAQRGFRSIELGTALKSDMVRIVKPQAEGQREISRILASQGKNLGDFAALQSIDPNRALSNLSRAMGLSFGKSKGAVTFRKKLGAELFKANNEGYATSDAFIDHLTQMLAKHKGVMDDEGIQNIRNSVVSSTLAPSGGFKFIDLLKTLVEAGVGDPQIASIFEGRQLARNKAFLDMFRKGENGISEYDQYVQMLRRMKGQGLGGVETLWSKSAIGNVKAMQAAWERLTVGLANAPGLQQFVNWAERAADGLSKLNPQFLDLAMRGLAMGVLVSPLINAAGALGMMGGAAFSAVSGFGKLMALPFFAASGFAAKAAKNLSDLALKGVMLGTGFKGLQRASMAASGLGSIARYLGKIARFAGPLALVAGAYELFQNWDQIAGFFDRLAGSESVGKLGEAFTHLSTALSPLGSAMASMVDATLRLFGIDPKKSSFFGAVTWMIDLFTALVDIIASAIDRFNQFVGLTDAPANKEPVGSQTGRWQTGPRGGQTFVPNGMYGPPAPDINGLLAPIEGGASRLNSAAGELGGTAAALDGSASALRSAADAINQAAARLQAPVVVNRGPAAAPAPRTDNAGQHNGGN